MTLHRKTTDDINDTKCIYVLELPEATIDVLNTGPSKDDIYTIILPFSEKVNAKIHETHISMGNRVAGFKENDEVWTTIGKFKIKNFCTISYTGLLLDTKIALMYDGTYVPGYIVDDGDYDIISDKFEEWYRKQFKSAKASTGQYNLILRLTKN